MQSDYLDDFQFVSYKRKGRKSAQKAAARELCTPQISNFDKATCIRRIEEAKEDVLASDFYDSVKASLREGLQLLRGHEISGIVCFGLGRFTECMTSRHQFALLLSLKDLYTSRVSVYDPVFTSDEREVLEHFKVDLIGENTEGRYRCGGRGEDKNDAPLLPGNTVGDCKHQNDSTVVFTDENCTGGKNSKLFSYENSVETLFPENIEDETFSNAKSKNKQSFKNAELYPPDKSINKSVKNESKSNKAENNSQLYDTTVFFLPHCPKQLSNNLLWANWGLDLSRCIIIGNSFTAVLEANTKREVRDNAEYLLRISPYVKELAVINSYRYYDIFNDTAIHVFPRETLALVPGDFWEDREEPVYNTEDVEFVRSAKIVE